MKMSSIPETNGRGKWGRDIKAKKTIKRERSESGRRGVPVVVTEHRSGSGVSVSVRSGRLVDRPYCPCIHRQNFFSSPCLGGWFANHDDLIDRMLARDARREYFRLLREHRKYLASRKAQKRGGR